MNTTFLKMALLAATVLAYSSSGFACGFVRPKNQLMFNRTVQKRIDSEAKAQGLTCPVAVSGAGYVPSLKVDDESSMYDLEAHESTRLDFEAKILCKNSQGEEKTIEFAGNARYTLKVFQEHRQTACSGIHYLWVSKVRHDEVTE